MLLELTDRVLHGCVIVQARGDVDFGSAPELDQRLSMILTTRAPAVVLDLSRLTFLDCAGLGVLVTASRRATSQGTVLALAAPRPAVARLLRITGLERHFTIFPTVAKAVTATRPDGCVGPGRTGSWAGLLRPTWMCVLPASCPGRLPMASWPPCGHDPISWFWSLVPLPGGSQPAPDGVRG